MPKTAAAGTIVRARVGAEEGIFGAALAVFALHLADTLWARHVWTGDLAIEVPAVLIGAGLLLQFGLTPVALAAILALQPWLTGSPTEAATVAGLLVFAGVAFAPLTFFVRGATGRQPIAALRLEREGGHE